MEADKTVSTQIEVSDLTTAFQTQVVPMPICKYEILNGGPTGEVVQFATIGQQVKGVIVIPDDIITNAPSSLIFNDAT